MTSPSNSPSLWSRRTFIEGSALTAAALVLPVSPAPVLTKAARSVTISGHHRLPGLATAGLALVAGGHHRVHATPYPPVALAVHPTRPLLYVAAVGPEPAVLTAYAFHRESLTLRALSTQSLSLAATQPTALAITPDAKTLLTLDRRGLLNLHSLHPDGSIGPLTCTRRLAGSPHIPGSLPVTTSLLLHPAGHLLFIADPACRRIVPVELTGSEGPAWQSAHLFPHGFEPAFMALQPGTHRLVVSSRSSSYFASLSLDPGHPHQLTTGPLFHALPREQRVSMLSFSPDGSGLLVSTRDGSATHRHTYDCTGRVLLHSDARTVAAEPRAACSAVLSA